MRAFQPNDKIKRAATVFAIQIVYAGLLLVASSICDASPKTISKELGTTDVSAINQNFRNIDNELANTVHKTSTETIRGHKYFVDPADFGAVTIDTATINNSLSMGGAIDMNSHKITELTNGSSSSDAAAFGQIPVVATQAEMETGTSNTVFVSPGRFQNHPGAAKAWAKITYSGSTPSAAASYNVTSLTDEGQGDISVNFTTAFSSTNYACVGTGVATLANTDSVVAIVISQTTGSCRVGLKTMDATHGGEDANSHWTFYGDQ